MSTQATRAVVTGAAGALGRALVARLAGQGIPVLGLDRSDASLPGATVERCDVATADFARIVRPGDVVFHLAAFVHRLPRTEDEIREVHEVNHHATARLAQACLSAGATLVFVSTVAVSADTEYGKSKAAAEGAIRKLGEGGLSFSIVRFPLLYGPHGHGNMERMLQAIGSGRYWPIGDPATPKSCLFLDDAAHALTLAAERGLGGTFVAAPDPCPSLGEIHAAAYAALGRRVPRFSVPRGAALAAARALQMAAGLAGRTTRLPDQIETLTAPAAFDGAPFARATRFAPAVGLAEGMRRTARWLEGGGVTGVLVLAGAALASALIVRLVRDFAHRRELLDLPNDRSSHDVPKPRLGGVGVVAPVLAVGAGLVALGQAPPVLLVPLAATGLVAVLGLVDDLRPLPARVRFGVQLVLASAVVAASWDRLPAAAGALGAFLPAPALAVLAVVWITWLTNLYNFMDGIDGLAGAQALIASLGLAAVAASHGAGPAGWLLLSLAGASAGFLAFNFPPSSIFLGDVGSTAVGFLVGVVPLLPGDGTVPIEPVALALSLFVLDATWTLLRRVARGERWYTPHRTHLYQRPVVQGVGHRSVLIVAAAGMVLVAGCAAMWAGASPPGRLGLAFVPIFLFAAGHAVVRRLERKVTSGSADRPKEA